MNFSLPTGLVAAAAVIIFSIISSLENYQIFLNLHGIVIVFGGTLAAGIICFPISQVINMVRVLYNGFRGTTKKELHSTIEELVNIAGINNEQGKGSVNTESIKNSFLKECLELWKQNLLSNEDLVDVMNKRLEQQHEKYRKEGTTFKTLGKFPPAFGLIGTSVGMIALLQGLNQPDAFAQIGPSMSIALTATFWGLVFANMILIPLGENLVHASEDDLAMRRAVIDGIVLINLNKHPILVDEYLKSYLCPSERNKIKSIAS